MAAAGETVDRSRTIRKHLFLTKSSRKSSFELRLEK